MPEERVAGADERLLPEERLTDPLERLLLPEERLTEELLERLEPPEDWRPL